MIKKAIENVLQPKIINLGYVSNWGNLVTTVKRRNFAEIGEGQTVEVEPDIFPVSCSTTHQSCWDEGRYLALSPDSSLASVAWTEWLGAETVLISDVREIVVSAPLRLVMWLNLGELGQTECGVPIGIQRDLLGILTADGATVAPGITAKFSPVRMLLNDFSEIFGRYTFDESGGLYMYPYAFVAVDFNVTVTASLAGNCEPAFSSSFTPSTAIECFTV